MQADFSVELGRDAPALEIPWHSNDSQVRYYNLKSHPEVVHQIPEAQAYPELASFLSRINATGFPLATAKCDVWSISEVAPEEEIFGDRKFASYIDLVFVDQQDQCSFGKHEAFARELCRLLSHAPETAATVELVIRHCYYHQEDSAFGKSSEPNVPQPSGTMGAPEINPSGNEDAIDHDTRADIAIDDELARVKERGERVEAKSRDEHRNLATQHKRARAMDHVEPYNFTDNMQAHATDLNDLVRTTKPELAALSRRQQSSSQESDTADVLHGNDLMPRSEESGNVPPERKPRSRREISSVTGFCVTAYVTGFGDHDHDPVRRWAIALHLLQNAIVQVNPNSLRKH